MKYVLMFTSTPELDDAMDPEKAQALYGDVFKWFEDHGEKLEGGAELHPRATATTVRGDGAGGTVVTDGPFSEAKEVIGGFTIADVPDLDAAIALTRSWPMLGLPGNSVEIRPMIEDYSQFD
jgi:hypothetical protein